MLILRALALALLVALPAGAQTDPLLQACVRQGNGKVRLVPFGTTCKPKETAVTWPTQGPDLSAFFTKTESDARYLAAGGTAVAAQSAATCDAADTATACTTAASATTCQSADTAQSAATCDYATTAGTCTACTTADGATSALDAARVGGVTVQSFAWRAELESTPAIVLSLGGFTLQAACAYYTPDAEAVPPINTLELTPATAVDDAIVHVLVDDHAPTSIPDFDVADVASPVRSAALASQGRFGYATSDGGLVQVDWMGATWAFGTTDCILRGVARYVPPAS